VKIILISDTEFMSADMLQKLAKWIINGLMYVHHQWQQTVMQLWHDCLL